MEEAAVVDLFATPLHPYTRGLMGSIPRLPVAGVRIETGERRLTEIAGTVPALSNLPKGCAFAPRCALADDRCRQQIPDYSEHRAGHWAACWHAGQLETAR